MEINDLRVLLDYCEGRGQFSEISTYKSMESSYGTSLLPSHIMTLDEEHQQHFCEMLVNAVAGHVTDLHRYVALLAQPLMLLAVCGHARLLKPSMPVLEAEYKHTQNISWWLAAPDDETLPTGIDFKKTWHYALILARTLHALGSAAAPETTNRLLQDAVSVRLRSQLDSLR
jgi:hypothetical protein